MQTTSKPNDQCLGAQILMLGLISHRYAGPGASWARMSYSCYQQALYRVRLGFYNQWLSVTNGVEEGVPGTPKPGRSTTKVWKCEQGPVLAWP